MFDKIITFLIDHHGAFAAFVIMFIVIEKTRPIDIIIRLLIISLSVGWVEELVIHWLGLPYEMVTAAQFIGVFGIWMVTALLTCIFSKKCRDEVFFKTLSILKGYKK